MGEKFAAKLYKWLEHLPRKPDKLLYDHNVREDLMTLEPTADISVKQREFVMAKLSLCCMVLAAGVFLSFIVWIKGMQNTDIVDNRIYRENYDGDSQNLKLTASDGEQSAQLELELMQRSLTEQEIEELYQKFLTELELQILGRNESLDHISYDLNLVNVIDGYPFKVEWIIPEKYMDIKGKLLKDALEQPQVEMLTARVSFDSFETEYSFGCSIYDRAEPLEMQEKLSLEILEAEEAYREKEYMILPDQFHGKELSWSRTKSNTGILYLFLTPVVAILLYIMKDRDLHKQVEVRAEEMQADYPDIVGKISLLISAGMTVQAAWSRVVLDYCRELEQTGKKRYAYEEMLLTVHEMENGLTARDALEKFGRRCRLAGYTRLSALLTQNLTKGSANLASMLQAEAANAFEERKHAARKLGEKAGTKLLVPMIMLLGIVMVIITVPTLLSY